MLFTKTLLFVVVVPGTVAGLVPWLLLSAVDDRLTVALGAARCVGLVVAVVGAWIGLWCVRDFAVAGRGTPAPIDPPKTLVVRGLYRLVRNPMYVGVLLILTGEAVFFESLVLLGYTAVVAVGFHLFVVGYEEPTLRRTFGPAYEHYSNAVPRWIPRHTR